MPKKKIVKGKNPSLPATPKAVTPPTQDELNALGIRDHQIVVSGKPFVKGHDGRTNLMDFRDTVETQTRRQPYLNEAEVTKLGIRGWWPYRNGEFTTITGGNRYRLTPEIFQDLKDRGLVIQCGVGDAPKWRNK